MFERFNNLPPMDYDQMNYDPYNNQVPYRAPSYYNNGYIANVNNEVPEPAVGNTTEDNLYPWQSQTSSPYESMPVNNSYARGGRVRGFKRGGLFGNPGKWFKSVAGGGIGSILGNILLPGAGGIIGGALGNVAGEAARGRKNYGMAALKGAGMGAAIPSVASLLSSGANALGATNIGSALSNYGTNNAILPSVDRLFGTSLGGAAPSIGNAAFSSPLVSSLLSSPTITSNPATIAGIAGENAAGKGFVDSLLSNSKNFFSQPSNLLTTAILGSSFLNRPKKPQEKTPEQLANEQKRYQKALMLSPEEMLARENQLLADEQTKRRVNRQKFLPEERLGPIAPLYARSHTPEEYKKKGRWFSYYNNPQFSGEPLLLKGGGEARIPNFLEIEEMDYPSGEGIFFEGTGGGQDDNVQVSLPENSYIVDASTVANLGDGNSRAGANKLEALVSDGEYYFSPQEVAKIGKGNNPKGVKLLDTLVKNVRKHKGGSTKLPPKAKPLNSYMRGKYA